MEEPPVSVFLVVEFTSSIPSPGFFTWGFGYRVQVLKLAGHHATNLPSSRPPTFSLVGYDSVHTSIYLPNIPPQFHNVTVRNSSFFLSSPNPQLISLFKGWVLVHEEMLSFPNNPRWIFLALGTDQKSFPCWWLYSSMFKGTQSDIWTKSLEDRSMGFWILKSSFLQ